jgi:hypothetical protein
MAAFLAEGSKFLFFDTSICRNTVWFPSGADSLPRVAEECSLGTTATFSIAAGAIFFLCLILVCLKAPEKRKLEPQYGTECDPGESDLESAQEYGHSEGSYVEGGGSADMYDMNGSEDRDSYDVPRPISRLGTTRDEVHEIQLTQGGTRRVSKDDPDFRHGPEHSGGEYSGAMSQVSGFHKRQSSGEFRDGDDLVSERLKNLDPEEDKYTARPKDDSEEDGTQDKYQPTKPASSTPAVDQTVSESRLHTIERMELNTTAESEDMIEKFVNELNVSFQVEKEEDKKKKDLSEETAGICQTLCAPAIARSF